jgi:hypothetical protein
MYHQQLLILEVDKKDILHIFLKNFPFFPYPDHLILKWVKKIFHIIYIIIYILYEIKWIFWLFFSFFWVNFFNNSLNWWSRKYHSTWKKSFPSLSTNLSKFLNFIHSPSKISFQFWANRNKPVWMAARFSITSANSNQIMVLFF